MSRSLLLLPLFALSCVHGFSALASTGCATVGATRDGISSNEQFGAAVACVDVNHDGYVDVLVGSPGQDRACIFLATQAPAPGSPLSSLPSWTFNGAIGSQTGASVSRVGDVNGDGYDDFAVGAPLYQGNGGVFVFLGGFSGPSSTPSYTLIGPADSNFGTALCGSDLDGDGFSDIVVGAPSENVSGLPVGGVFVFRGSRNGPMAVTAELWARTGDAVGARFGASVCAEDLDGDHLPDLVVGAPGENAGVVQVFRVQSLPTGELGLSFTPVTIPGEAAGDAFGAAVRGIERINAGGRADLVVGAPNHSSVGRAYLCRFGASLDFITQWTADGDQTGGKFGGHLATADVTGDGLPDVLVSAEAAGIGGRVSLFAFQADGTLAATPTQQFEGEQSGERFGSGLDAGGFLNLDGWPDFVVGARLFAYPLTTGRIYAFLADPTCASLTAVPDAIASGTELGVVGANPFRATARVSFALQEPATVELRVLDMAGRLVQVLADGAMAAGRSEAVWNGRTATGAAAPPGVYFVELWVRSERRSVRLLKLT